MSTKIVLGVASALALATGASAQSSANQAAKVERAVEHGDLSYIADQRRAKPAGVPEGEDSASAGIVRAHPAGQSTERVDAAYAADQRRAKPAGVPEGDGTSAAGR